MDGDLAPLSAISALCQQYRANLVVDEAHATGVIGNRGEGLVQSLGLQADCFARIHTFGKACGAMGAIVLGGAILREFLINFSRSFIYTTALPETVILTIRQSYRIFPQLEMERRNLSDLIDQFRAFAVPFEKANSHSAIQAVIIPGNAQVKMTAARLQEKGLDVRPILYPSVPIGAERLRIVLHSFNTMEELFRLEEILTDPGEPSI